MSISENFAIRLSSTQDVGHCSNDVHIDPNALKVRLLTNVLVMVVEENRRVVDRHEAIGRYAHLGGEGRKK